MRDLASAACSSHRYACTSCKVSRNGICADLDDAALASLYRASQRKTLACGRVIFSEGDDAGTYFSITSGIVKLVKALADGRQHIIGLVHQPNFIGQMMNRQHTYSAETVTKVELCIYPRTAFDAFRKSHISLDRKIFEITVRELDVCRDWILLLGRKSAYERVAGFLLMMAGQILQAPSLEPNTVYFELPLTRTEIADYLGLTLETVSRQFSRLKRAHLIALPSSRDIEIPDIKLLAATARLESCCHNFDEALGRRWAQNSAYEHFLPVHPAEQSFYQARRAAAGSAS